MHDGEQSTRSPMPAQTANVVGPRARPRRDPGTTAKELLHHCTHLIHLPVFFILLPLPWYWPTPLQIDVPPIPRRSADCQELSHVVHAHSFLVPLGLNHRRKHARGFQLCSDLRLCNHIGSGTDVPALGWRVGSPMGLPRGLILHYRINLSIRCHAQALAEGVARASPRLAKDASQNGTRP